MISKKEHVCDHDVHVLRKWQGYFRISEFEIGAVLYSSLEWVPM